MADCQLICQLSETKSWFVLPAHQAIINCPGGPSSISLSPTVWTASSMNIWNKFADDLVDLCKFAKYLANKPRKALEKYFWDLLFQDQYTFEDPVPSFAEKIAVVKVFLVIISFLLSKCFALPCIFCPENFWKLFLTFLQWLWAKSKSGGVEVRKSGLQRLCPNPLIDQI